MVAILGDAGKSIADLYDVEGSIVDIRELHTAELPIVHEMGATLFSERYSGFLRNATSGAIIQSTAFNVVIDSLPAGPFRIYGVTVFINNAGRIDFASVAIRNPLDGREMPIWIWDSSTDAEVRVRFSDDGAAVGTQLFLQPNAGNVIFPQLIAGLGQPQDVRDIAFRGISTAFGAGNVTCDLLVHVGFSQVGGLSSRGLPIPSW